MRTQYVAKILAGEDALMEIKNILNFEFSPLVGWGPPPPLSLSQILAQYLSICLSIELETNNFTYPLFLIEFPYLHQAFHFIFFVNR